MKRAIFSLLALCAFVPSAFAQFDNQWLTLVPGANLIQNPDGSAATHITADTDEKDWAWGDLDKDGWTDVVLVRKLPFGQSGKRVNYLLMNEGGILVDRSTQYASASTVVGDLGFNTPTDDRDVELADVNGDGWLDVITAVADLAGADPKHIGHPRIYMNLGDDINGDWLGLLYDEPRIPQLFTIATASSCNPGGAIPGGMARAGRFCDMHFGDVDNDGDVDLYFIDYDRTEPPFNDVEPVANDLNDRLLLNDGTGFFADSGQTRLTCTMLRSAFGTACEIQDMNGDGRKDIVKCTTLDSAAGWPVAIALAYNDANAALPNGNGFFDVFDNDAFTGQPYHVAAGDLNNDGNLDIAVGDDGIDGYKFNTGNDALGQVIWSAKRNFTWLSGSSDDGGNDGFPGENNVVDLNVDGWADVFISDVDVDLPGCNGRSILFHNQGGTVGSTTIPLVEEKQQAGAGGWFGAVGLFPSDMTGGYAAAFPDLDNDGDPDMIIGRCSGTFVWKNQTDPCPAINYGQSLPNSTGQTAQIGNNGATSLSANTMVLTCTGLPPNKAGIFYFGTVMVDPCVPFGNGLRCAGGTITRLPVTISDANGNVSYPLDFNLPQFAGIVPGDIRYFQFWYRDPSVGAGFNTSDALEVHFCQ